MGFDYKKHGKDHGDSMWTSYSDLFLGLSIIFLLLYVSASLRQGTDGIKQHLENKDLKQTVGDLQQQIKAYEAIKQNYIEKQASADEAENYKELMDKLDLLQEEAKEEKTKLRLQAMENEKKEQALNKYQQMIRNVINANLIAKGRIKSRDTLIDTQSEEIEGLEETVEQKTAEIKKGEQRIDSLEDQLDDKLKALQQAYKTQKITKAKFEAQRAALQRETEQKISVLKEKNAQAQAELDAAAREIASTNEKLTETTEQLVDKQKQLGAAQGSIAQLGQEKSRLEGELQGAAAKHAAEVDKLRGLYAEQAAKEKAGFEAALAKERLSGAEKAAKERAFAAQAAAKAKDLEGKIADLDGKFKATQGELARAQENLQAKKKLAAKIKESFNAKGIGADVDPGSGDVMLSFGDSYFDTGSANLKPQMRDVLQKAMPAYSQSLFQDPKIANKIQSVEIVGFASPTYQGKFIDPNSLDPADRKAVQYNLDLSYGRARSIFNYVFDKNKMSFEHQQKLLPLVKVTGRSFLARDVDRSPSATGSAEDFCKKNDCAKLQRVIIKFTLKD